MTNFLVTCSFAASCIWLFAAADQILVMVLSKKKQQKTGILKVNLWEGKKKKKKISTAFSQQRYPGQAETQTSALPTRLQVVKAV